jgi:phosphoribosylanthranilate isomerase
MKIKICGLSRDEDVDYVNEALPDFAGFVFAQSKREVSPAQAARLRRRLAESVTTIGVFVNAPVEDISALYRDGVISLAQLHGNEDETYISRLKNESTKGGPNPVQVIKVI